MGEAEVIPDYMEGFESWLTSDSAVHQTKIRSSSAVGNILCLPRETGAALREVG